MKRNVLRWKTMLSLMLAVVMLMATCVASVGAAEEVEPVKVAFLYPLSGANADAGDQDLKGAQLAVKHINEAGGIKSLGGAKVELVIGDVTSDPAQSKNVAERVLSSGDILGAVGCGISALTLPVLPVTEKLQIPILTICNAKDITGQGYQYIFEITPYAKMFGETQIEFLKWLQDNKGYNTKKIALIYENSAWGISASNGSRALAQENGFEIVYDESFPAGLTDASSIVTAMKNSGAEVVLPTAYTQEAKLLVNTMNSLDYRPVIIGGGGGFLWPAFAQELGDSVNGIVSVANWDHATRTMQSNPEFVKILDDYRASYGTWMPEHAGPTYACYMTLFKGIEAAGSRDTVAIRDALSQLEYDSMIQPGPLEFIENGWNHNSYPVIIQYQNNEPVTVFPEGEATGEFKLPEELK